MGFFERFKKQETAPAAPKPEAKPFAPTLAEIARVISSGDEAVLRDISSCTENPQGWFSSHQDQYMNRCITSAEDSDLIQWLGLVDILEEHGYVCERDWKDELEDFLYFVQNLHGFQTLGLTIDPSWLNEDEDISAWCNILMEKWSAKGARMAAIDIDSDSYVLFPTLTAPFPALQALAEEIGHCIDFVGRE